MSGNLARRRQTKFMPADFKLIEARQPPLKDQYDEWLARIICYAFSVPVSPFIAQVNRATGETMRQQATQEGLVPLKAWVKNALDHVIQVCMNEPELEFVWVGDDAIDPLEQAQTLEILISAGIKTREEARADLGLAPSGGGAAGKAQAGPPVAKRGASHALLGKFNPHHDERGQFASADNAAGPVGKPERKPQRTPVQVASNDAVMSDVGGVDVAQIIEPEPPPLPPEPEALRPEASPPAAPTGTVAEAVLRDGKLPGTPEPSVNARTMSASDDPTAAAKAYAQQMYNGQRPKSEKPLGNGGLSQKCRMDRSLRSARPDRRAIRQTRAPRRSKSTIQGLNNSMAAMS